MSLRWTAFWNFSGSSKETTWSFGIEQVAFAIVLVIRPGKSSRDCGSRQTECAEVARLNSGVPVFSRKAVSDHNPRMAERFGFRACIAALLRGAWMALLSRPHVLAIHFVVPPGIAEVGGDHVRPGVNVTNDALARRNRARELMTNGMAGFIARDGGIGSRGLSLIAVSCV